MAQAEQAKADPTAEAILKLAAALVAQGPQKPLDVLGWSHERQAEVYGLGPDGKPKKVLRHRMIRGVSPETEATFTMAVVESRTHPAGRIVGLQDYHHPDKAYIHEADGGFVPDGAPIYKTEQPTHMPAGVEPPKSSLCSQFLQWRWTEFYQKDLRSLLGNGKRGGELKAMYCADPTGMNTPWQDGA